MALVPEIFSLKKQAIYSVRSLWGVGWVGEGGGRGWYSVPRIVYLCTLYSVPRIVYLYCFILVRFVSANRFVTVLVSKVAHRLGARCARAQGVSVTLCATTRAKAVAGDSPPRQGPQDLRPERWEEDPAFPRAFNSCLPLEACSRGSEVNTLRSLPPTRL